MKRNLLELVPVREHAQWEVRDGKVLLIFSHEKPIERFVRWLVKKPKTSDVELDEPGSEVWSAMDGERTVLEISQRLDEVFGADFDPDCRRLGAYLNYLRKKGWISFRQRARGPIIDESDEKGRDTSDGSE